MKEFDEKETEIETGPEEEEEEEHKLTQEDLEELIEAKDVKAIREIFVTVPDIDIAEAADNLSSTDLIWVFRAVESKYTAGFFSELDQDAQENLVKAMTDKELIQVINEQSVDDVTDSVGEMPANLAARVLSAASKDMRDDINRLLRYKDQTAGAIMTTEYLEFKDTTYVDDAIETIRKRGKDAETIYTLFVKDKNRDFVGTVDLDDLIFAKKDQRLRDIMNQDVVSVTTSTDQEEVGQMFRRYDLNALAVLNDDDKLVGIITIDDAVDVMTEESTEDIAKMNAVVPSDEPYLDTTVWSTAKKCFPWLIVLLVLGTFSSMILSVFQDKISTLAILAAFIPVLMDTGGNAGGQTTAVMVRALALKEFEPKDYFKVVWKEVRSAMIVAAIVASFAFIWFTMEQYTGIVANTIENEAMGLSPDVIPTIWNGECWSPIFFGEVMKISATVAGTLFIGMVASKFVGTSLTVGAAAIKKDPALLAQPILTTIMDITSLLIYFAICITVFPQLR